MPGPYQSARAAAVARCEADEVAVQVVSIQLRCTERQQVSLADLAIPAGGFF